MSNPANRQEILACIEAGIDLFVWSRSIQELRSIAPNHFTGVGTHGHNLIQEDIMSHAFNAMRNGADMYYTLRSYDVMEKLSKEGIPVHSHIGLIPTFSHYCGGLRGWGEVQMKQYKFSNFKTNGRCWCICS